MGKSSPVKAQTVLYRQHDRNVIGIGSNVGGGAVKVPTRSWWERIRRPRIAAGHVLRWEVGQRQARAFLNEHGSELTAKKRALLRGFLRCYTSRSRVIRVATLIRYGFYYLGLKPNLAIMVYLWNMRWKNASRPDGSALPSSPLRRVYW